ncbi:MAG: trigger factor [Planctomycetes bacterium]|nr:trigger factor [Planctomycetota bacterium]
MSSQSSPAAHPVEAQIEETGPCSRLIKISVPQARVDAEIESTFRNVEKTVQFPGFRQGKAPRKLVEAKLGAKVLEEVKERLVQSAVDEVIDEKKLLAVGSPRIEWGKVELARGRDFAFDIGIDVRPTFELPNLAELSVTRPDLTVTEAHVDADVQRLREERATVRDGGDDGLREKGIVSLQVKVQVGEETIVEAADVEWQHGPDVLGGMQIDGLSAGLLGKRKGETSEFTQKLPDDFRDEAHRGQDAKIALTIQTLQHVDLPEADDAFAKDMDYDDVADMRAELRKKLERQAEGNRDAALDGAIVEALLQAVPFDVPPSLIASETERMLRRYEAQFRRQGIADADIEAQLRQLVGAAAERVKRDLRASFLLDKVAAERKVFVTESEIRQEIARMAQRYDRSLAQMEATLESQGILAALRSELREKKTVADLRGVVKVVEPEAKI